MDYESILDQLVDGGLSEYKMETKDASAFQQILRAFGKRTYIEGHALRDGAVTYATTNVDK